MLNGSGSASLRVIHGCWSAASGVNLAESDFYSSELIKCLACSVT